MERILYTEINAFALAVLIIILINVRHRPDRRFAEQRIFLALLFSVALVLITDTAMWVLDGQPWPWVHGVLQGSTMVYLVLNPVSSALWMLYVEYQIHKEERRLRKIMIPALLPLLVSVGLTLANFGERRHFFYIDAQNVYSRGDMLYILLLASFFYLLYPTIQIIRQRKAIDKRALIPMAAFAVLPFAAGLLQWFFFGVTLLWPAIVLSLLIVFINIQNKQMYTDHLTGLYNRRQLDQYLHYRVVTSTDERILGGIMIDVDSFKMINDTYGHQAGDKALEDTASILKTTFRKNDFIARYGGDEFLAVIEARDRDDLPKMVERLKENVGIFNETNTEPYRISLSIGYDYLEGRSKEAVSEFLRHIDRLMYADKSQK